MLPAQQGYDRAITVFSPDGRLYQVEYAIETVRRGSIAVGVKSREGVVIGVEESSRKLQISDRLQKIFQVDSHIGVAAAGYIPDARSQVDNARFFSQSNRLIYDEDVDVETVARHVSDQCQQFTQFAGVRPFGVALILAGVDGGGDGRLFLTDPSGTYVSYDAVAIGAGSDGVTAFLEKAYTPDIGLAEATQLAAAAIQKSRNELENGARVRMARIPASTRSFEIIPDHDVESIASAARSAYADAGS